MSKEKVVAKDPHSKESTERRLGIAPPASQRDERVGGIGVRRRRTRLARLRTEEWKGNVPNAVAVRITRLSSVYIEASRWLAITHEGVERQQELFVSFIHPLGNQWETTRAGRKYTSYALPPRAQGCGLPSTKSKHISQLCHSSILFPSFPSSSLAIATMRESRRHSR